MGKRSKITTSSKNSKTKFIIIGIVAVIAVAGIAAISMNSGSVNGNNSKATKLSLDTRGGSPVLGDASSLVTIVEFGDYQCPFCKRWNENIKPVIEKNFIETGKASLIYMDFPIIGPDSVTVHAGSYCAAEQRLYWKYHDFIYAHQGHENGGWANSQNIKSLASGIDGLDMDLFGKCLDSKKYEQRVNDNKKIAIDAGAKSTPSFIIIAPNRTAEFITGAQPYDVFKTIIEDMTS